MLNNKFLFISLITIFLSFILTGCTKQPLEMVEVSNDVDVINKEVIELDYNDFPDEGDYNPDLYMDKDNDYLLGHEEINIYKTDPNNPDTDGDGYLDGEEVIKGFNPNGEGKLR